MNALVAAALFAAAAFVPLMNEGDVVPAIPLIDQNGHAFSLQSLHGEAVIVSFIYTRCPDPRMCPLVSSKFAQLQRIIGNARVHLVELTLDPHFDTPSVLQRYGAAFGARSDRWTLATGEAGALDELAQRFGIATERTKPGTVVHTEAAIVIDRDGAVARIIEGNHWTPQDVLALAREATGERPAIAARIRLWLTAAIERCGGGSRGTLNALGGLALLSALIAASGAGMMRAFVPRGVARSARDKHADR